jgi:signal peptidase II
MSGDGSHADARRGVRRVFWAAAVTILGLDVATKYLALARIAENTPIPIFGDWLRLTLLFNPGAAFGLHLGPYCRWIFTVLSLAALVILWGLYRATLQDGRGRALAIGLVFGGALGNLVNRLWSARGVVDWIDVGAGPHRWPSFNIADMGVSAGAFLLAWALWGEDGGRGTDPKG